MSKQENTGPHDCWDASEKINVGADVPHVFRYYIARGFIEDGDRVIDASCGYGYGSQILARSKAKSVYGIDKGIVQIMQAKTRNKAGNVNFDIIDLDKEFNLPKSEYIVSIETIEHLEDPEKTINRFKKAAKKMLLSVPIGITTTHNEWHKHDFVVRDDLIKLVEDENWKLFHSATHGGGVHELFYFVKK